MRTASAKARLVLLAGALCAPLAVQAAKGQPAPDNKTTFSLRTYIEQDDNVSLVSEDEFAADPIESTSAGVMLTLGRRLYRSPGFELRGSIVGFHTTQLSSDAEDFDVTGIVPRLSLTKRAHAFGKPASWSGALSLRRDWLGGEGFSRLVDLNAGLMINLTRSWSVGPAYSISSRDYDDEGLDPAVTSRNALRHTLGLTSQWLFPSPAGVRSPARFSLSLSSQRNSADGSNIEFAGAVASANLDLPLTPASAKAFSNCALQFGLSAVDVDYDEFQLDPERSDRRLTGSLTFSAQLRALGKLDVSYTRFDFDSNRPEYRATRNLLRLGVTHSF